MAATMLYACTDGSSPQNAETYPYIGKGGIGDPSPEGKDQLYLRLTQNIWCRKAVGGSPLPGTSITYQFRRDGTFSYLAVSDYVEGEAAGNWNFLKTSSEGGRLYLDNGHVLNFSFNADGSLTVSNTSLTACGTPVLTKGAVDVSNLPKIDVPPRLYDLAKQVWKKTSDFDTLLYPLELSFELTGSLTAIFEGGCQYQTPFSLTGTDVEPDLLMHITGEDCDFRTAFDQTTTHLAATVVFDGRFLRFDGATYAGPDQSPSQGTEIVGLIYSGARLVISFSRPVKGDQTTRFEMELRNISGKEMTLQTVTFTQTRLQKRADGFEAIASPVTLIQRDFSGTVLKPGPNHIFGMDINIQGKELILLQIKGPQIYSGRADFIFTPQ